MRAALAQAEPSYSAVHMPALGKNFQAAISFSGQIKFIHAISIAHDDVIAPPRQPGVTAQEQHNMEDESAVAEATPANDVDSGSLGGLTPDQRTEWNKTGELPKSEEAAPSTEPKPQAEAEPAGDSEAPQAQDKTGKPKPTASERITQLRATIAKIEKEAGLKTEVAESSPAKPAAEAPKPQEFKPTRPKPTPEGNGPDGKPYEDYEEFRDDRDNWLAEQRDAKTHREAERKAQLDHGIAKVEEAKTRYKDFETIGKTFWEEVVNNPDINPTIKAMIDDSEYFADLAYTIGSDPAELAKFKAMPAGKQIRYIALTESLIADELDGKKVTTEETPAKPQTRAPRPPSEAGGRAASPPDAEAAAAAANDFRSFAAESTRKHLAKLKTG